MKIHLLVFLLLSVTILTVFAATADSAKPKQPFGVRVTRTSGAGNNANNGLAFLPAIKASGANQQLHQFSGQAAYIASSSATASPVYNRSSSQQVTATQIPKSSSTNSASRGNSTNGGGSGNGGGRGSIPKNREQYLLNIFEVIVSTLETKLQRIENLEKAVEHLMRRVEALDSRFSYNIDKTDSIILKLRNLDTKLFQYMPKMAASGTGAIKIPPPSSSDLYEKSPLSSDGIGNSNSHNNIDVKLVSLDQKVTDIDSKLVRLKHQLDSNFLPGDDINVEASEKRYASVKVPPSALDSSKLISAELESIKGSVNNIDKKLQFHLTTMADSMNKVTGMVTEIHQAVLEPLPIEPTYKASNVSSAGGSGSTMTMIKTSKLDRLSRQMHPILSVSEKMDEVWDVVVGTKTSVDDLVPKSDELLTQTQRQERAINDIHQDLRQNTHKIIANLDMVEKRLKKQEDDVVSLAQRPVPAELLLDPTIDRLVEYDQNRYNAVLQDEPAQSQPQYSSTEPSSLQQQQSSYSTSSTAFIATTSPTSINNFQSVFQITKPPPLPGRNRGVVFPSVKNKPSPTNTTFASDVYSNLKDVKGYSCWDLLNAGMKHSGVYYLQIRGTTYWYLKVYCEQEIADGGWTVIQRRDDFGEPRESFNRDWADYKNGFGDQSKEFWLGNENIYMLTNNEEYSLRVELEDFDGNKRYAQYSHFKIYSELEYYKLEIDGYEGNAGDSLNDPWYGSNNSPFSTYNRDNDRSSLNCASMLKGGWWWKSCGRGLNGLYLNDPQDLTARQGIVWFRWRGWDYTLKRSVMMIRPRSIIQP